MIPTYQFDTDLHTVEPIQADHMGIRLAIDGKVHQAELRWLNDHEAELVLDGRTHEVFIAQNDTRIFIQLGGILHTVDAVDDFAGSSGSSIAGSGAVAAPMPGAVLRIAVEPGNAVLANELLMVIESMKMQMEIKAPIDGVVTSVNVSVGDAFDRGSILVAITAPED